jgi:hypothetical protein
MSTLILFVVAGLIVDVLGVVGFAAIAGTGLAVPGKTVVAVLYCLATVALLSVAESRLQVGRLIVFAGLMAVGMVAVYQALGFWRFSGLVKDVEPFSSDHLRISLIVMALAFLGYLGAIFLVRGTKKAVGISHREAR